MDNWLVAALVFFVIFLVTFCYSMLGFAPQFDNMHVVDLPPMDLVRVEYHMSLEDDHRR